MKKLSYILLCGLMLILSACEKDTESSNFAPVVTTGTASNIYRMGATLSGSIQLTETNTAKEYGILFSELESMAEYDEYPVKDGSTSYSVLIQNLEPGETYYYCAYASSGYSIAKSQIKSFTTTQSNAPVFNEVILQSKDEKSCAVSVELLDEGGSELLMTGFVWGEAGSGDPTIKSNVVNVEPQGSRMSATIKGMEPNKSYLVRAYGVNAQGVGYSNSISVTTNTATVPVLSDIIAPDSTEVSVTVRSSIVDAGLGEVTKVGFCYSSESKNPTTDHLVVEEIHGSPESEYFAAIIEGLKPETTYYIRAYAINEKGTGYSETFVYTTKKQPLIEGTEGNVYVANAGGLSNFINNSNKFNIVKLKVRGYLNGDDIRLIREMAGRDVNGNETNGRLVDLDISEATIVEGGGAYMTDAYTSNDEIGYMMFANTILENILLPNGISKMGYGVFWECHNLIYAVIPDGVMELPGRTFHYCYALKKVTLSANLKSISEGDFFGCISLTDIKLPDSITSIAGYAFSDCSSLTNINIPIGITSIGNNAFERCYSLKEVTCNAINPPSLGVSAFFNIANPTVLIIPASCYTAYSESDWTTYFPNIISEDGLFVLKFDFNDGNCPFYNWGDGVVIVENGELKISNPTSGPSWNFQMAIDVSRPFIEGMVYKLTMDIKGSVPGSIYANLQIASDYRDGGSFGEINFDLNEKTIEVTAECVTDDATRLIFNLGAFVGDIYIDNFSLISINSQ